MTTLFPPFHSSPLAEKLRPQTLEDVIGQEHLTGPGGVLHTFFLAKRFPSLILWGPPGCGKTTLAHLIAQKRHQPFAQLSAVFAGVADLRKIFDQAQQCANLILFIDEIHRFNKSQQDALLGPLEKGLITLIGVTTQNPSFALNAALLSRARVLTLNPLTLEALETLLAQTEKKMGTLPLTPLGRQQLLQMADGDGRMLLNLTETLLEAAPKILLEGTDLQAYVQHRCVLYDNTQDYHYNLISAFIKSMRGSDPNASLYWMARLLIGGEDPLYLARRMIRFASEDIGLADPNALIHATSSCLAYERLGSPEGELSLANTAVYLATAPKSNSVYKALSDALKAAKETGSLPAPLEIVNAPTNFMKEQGYGKGYIYDHDCPNGFSGQNYFPSSVTPFSFYHPVERGYERDVKKRLDYWEKLKNSK